MPDPTGYTAWALIPAAATAAESATFLHSGTNLITLANLRSEIMDGRIAGGAIYVPATGVAATDTAAIQAAIDTLTYTTSDLESGCVLLSGQYNINAKLVVGGSTYNSSNTNKPVSLIGIGSAQLYWAGTPADDYMLFYIGEGVTPGPRLANIYFHGNHEVRGVFMGHQAYAAQIKNCHFKNFLKVSLDMDSCYGFRLSNCQFTGVRGMALRLTGSSPGIVEDCAFGGYGIYHASNESAANLALVEYEMENGEAAAETYYTSGAGGPDNYVDGFPATNDSVPTRYDETALQTAEVMRAAISIASSCVTLKNCAFESMHYGHYPLVAMQTAGSSIENIRCEDNHHSEEMIKVYCTSSQYFGKANKISGIQIGYTGGAEIQSKYVVEIDATASNATSYGNTVECVTANNITQAVVALNGGTHAANKVQNCFVVTSGSTRLPLTKKVGTPTISGTDEAVQMPSFTNSTARDAAWTEPHVGQMCLLTASDEISSYNGTGWVEAAPPAP